jgi:uncharacterized membrane protein YkoI
MNTAQLRTKRVILPTIAAVAALGIGGVVWASTASADLDGSERNRASTAATEAVGGGKVIDAESSDDPGEAYEVEVRKTDGTEVDVTLDKDLNVLRQDTDDRDDRNDQDDTNEDLNDNDANDRDDVNDNDANDTRDADDRKLSATERSSAEQAARNAVGGGTIVDLDASDDRGEAYEVEVRKSNGTEWDVTLDSKFKVLDKVAEN